MYTTIHPPVIPRKGETYAPAAEDPPAGDICVPWSVIDIEHTVWPEEGKVVFESRVFLQRDATAVEQAVRMNDERRAKREKTKQGASATKKKPSKRPTRR